MDTTWLSESISKGARSAILLGPLNSEIIEKELESFPLGILWVSSDSNINFNLPQKVQFINKENSTELITKSLQDFITIDYDSPPTVKLSIDIAKDSLNEYNSILDLIIAEIDSTMRARRTRTETGFIRQRQVFTNLAGYLQNRLPVEWNNLADKKLVVVVGAGPSLDITLPLLQNGIPRPIIIAADSSLRALKQNQLDPDFVISIDPEKSFESCSENGYSPGIAVLSSQSHGSWPQAWNKKCCFLSGRVITEDWLSEKGISKTNILAINNAGLTALAFANFINPAAILTVGMDLASGGIGQERYAENTQRSHIQIHASHYHDVPGNFSDTVKTPFLSDWQETSDFCYKISKNKTLINLNDRGAKLNGTTLIHPDHINDLKKVLNESISNSSTLEFEEIPPRKSLKGMGLNQFATHVVTLCDQCWRKLQVVNYECEKSMLEILRDIFSNKEIASLLGDFAFSIMPKIGPGKKPSLIDLKEAYQQLESLLWKLEDAILQANPSDQFLIRFFTEKFD